ncbi:MAG: hypothetical protein ACR2M7_03270 [Bdellovibrionales bacterium]
MTKIFVTISCLFLSSCAGIPPVQEYSLAYTALRAAEKFEAGKYAPTPYRKAIYYYRKGKKSFNKRLYIQARDLFEKCLESAEESENLTRWDRYKKGDHSL